MRDDVRTGNGRIKIDFLDGSILRVTEQSKVVIDEFVYDPNPSKGKLAVNFASGTARFATGKMNRIDKKNVSIKTPTSQIAVRGTDFTITVDELGRSLVILLPDENGAPSGEILVATNGGSVVTSVPSTRMRPAGIGTTPAISPRRVDFPLPLGPRIATISDAATVRDTPVRKVTPSYPRARSSTASRGGVSSSRVVMASALAWSRRHRRGSTH